ncbi:MAG TPA: AMP-binding protein, partial [Planctomycetaceae bacterium]|nr:AMP-binding protein [Planctomycetaceae bacterium]
NRLGNLCIAAGGMSSQARLNLLLENDANVVCCTPTYALRLAEVAFEQKIDLAASSVRAVLVAGEPGGNIPATRQRIETAWGAKVVDHWGMTELGPLAIESLDRPGGLFVLEPECIAEIIDSHTGKPAEPGDEGELVITNLGRLGSPLIRYRTGDRVRADAAQPRGRLLFLRQGILGRTDEMLTVRGNNVYPSALEDVIRQFGGVAEFRIELSTVKAMQHLKIEIEPAASLPASEARALVMKIGETIKSHWHFQAEVVAVAAGSLPRFEMKGRRFTKIDSPASPERSTP